MDADPSTSDSSTGSAESPAPDNGSDTPTDDYDSPWKEAIEVAFADFMAFYFPAACEQIDWSCEPEFLEQELRQVVPEAEAGKRIVDKLVKVGLRNGTMQWVYIHIEVQKARDSDFTRRMLTYHYRLLDRYLQPVASLAILADDSPNWRPSVFHSELFGCRLELSFPVVKLTDYADQLGSLLTSENFFALVTAAHLLAQQTRKAPQRRYDAKLMLIRLLYKRGWSRPRINQYIHVVDWMMRLPETLKQRLWQDIQVMEENRTMRYITSFEEIGIAEGMKKGLQKGLQQGLRQGLEQGLEQGREQGRETGQRQEARIILRKQLTLRFGLLPQDVLARLEAASTQRLEVWAEKVLFAPTLNDIFTDTGTDAG